MDAVEDYIPTADFQEDVKDPLLEIPLTDSTELWLIQWPINQPPDFDGQEVSLKLHHDGQLGSFESSSGKSYEVVSYATQEPDATVFLSSASESKIVGKISRRVCLVHYPEPSELEQANSYRQGRTNQRFGGTPSSFLTPTQGSRQRSSLAVSGISHGSMFSLPNRTQSSLFDSGEPSSKRPKRKHVRMGSEGRRSDVSSLGSAGTSRSEKSKGKIKKELE
ncbi:hypothetical protein BVC80_8969g22 [Macleaya cordata]|uniref:Mediator-associated protein 2 n=1 Tax=Macleaya cordata TaxID=56857 RepID=A0A200QJJ0_MACCD|nr:hypothetical protein BVC80_8969g22 [Macleaya cordata]